MTIIQIYAPTSDYDDEYVDIFYEEIEKTITETNKKDILIIQGDWNSIVDDSNKEWNNAVGQFYIVNNNSRDIRLLEFATKHNFTLANTLYYSLISPSTKRLNKSH